MTKADLQWIAGLLEGEGCFTKRGNPGTIYSRITVMCQMTDADVLHRLCLLAECGKVRGPYKNGPRGRLPRYMWQVLGHKAYKLMCKLYPYMCSRRQKRINELMTEYETFKPKVYRMLNINSGRIEETTQMSKWLKRHNILDSSLYRTLNGDRTSCHGWKRLS